jgi:chromosomal replication initiation ATPase DnaA
MYIEERMAKLELRVATLEQIAGRIVPGKDTAHSKYDYIERVVAQHFGISQRMLRSKVRSEQFAWPRQLTHDIAARVLRISALRISRMAKKDHGTIAWSRRVVKERLGTSSTDRSDYFRIMEHIAPVFNFRVIKNEDGEPTTIVTFTSNEL